MQQTNKTPGDPAAPAPSAPDRCGVGTLMGQPSWRFCSWMGEALNARGAMGFVLEDGGVLYKRGHKQHEGQVVRFCPGCGTELPVPEPAQIEAIFARLDAPAAGNAP